MFDSAETSLLKDILANIVLYNSTQINKYVSHRSFSFASVAIDNNVFSVLIKNFTELNNLNNAFYIDDSGNAIDCAIEVIGNDSFKVILPYKPLSFFDIRFIISLEMNKTFTYSFSAAQGQTEFAVEAALTSNTHFTLNGIRQPQDSFTAVAGSHTVTYTASVLNENDQIIIDLF